MVERITLESEKSSLERDMEELLVSLGYLPQIDFETQVPFMSWVLDFYFRSRKICLETDGHRNHFTKEGRRKDRFRDRQFRLIGIQTYRFTGEDMTDKNTVSKRLQEILSDSPVLSRKSI